MTDALIIYLAFGSPMMVYRYLLSSRLGRTKRILVSILTLGFWVPLAAQMVYRRLTNAYSRPCFVARENLDSVEDYLADLRKGLKAELTNTDRGISIRDVMLTVERYVGLLLAASEQRACVPNRLELFTIAGTNAELSSVCMVRRNRRRIADHQRRARTDLLFVYRALSAAPTARAAVDKFLMNILRLLHDRELVRLLEAPEIEMDRSWTLDAPSLVYLNPSPIPSMAMTIAPSSSTSEPV